MPQQGLEVFLDELATSQQTVTEAASQGRAEAQDVIQITEKGHAWFAALLVVTEVTPLGVTAELAQVGPDNTLQVVSCTLAFEQFQRIGRAVVHR